MDAQPFSGRFPWDSQGEASVLSAKKTNMASSQAIAWKAPRMESISTGTRVGLVVNPARKRDYLSKFRELIESPPKRTGKPRNPSPSQMKKIWKERLS